MVDQHDSDGKGADDAALAESLDRLAEQSQRLIESFLKRRARRESPPPDPLNIGAAFSEMAQRMLENPERLVAAQFALWQRHIDLWRNTARRLAGEDVPPLVTPERDDRRFRDPEWTRNPLFDFIKQSYLLTAGWLQDTVGDVDGLDPKTAAKVEFHTRQFADAMAPTNFVATNPEVLRATNETGGRNLVQGLENLLADLEHGEGRLRVRTSSEDHFQVGRDLAATPGMVVFQNRLIQLLQYAPVTDTVHERPLLIIAPWINKYYVLDLRPENSFIRWAVAQGHTVFAISWVNPDGALSETSFEDYMADGILAALDAIERATGSDEVNAVGYCIGGTLLAATLAAMAAHGDARIVSATFLTSMVDFAEPGDLGVFIDAAQLEFLEARMAETGYLDGADMATTFSMLRANDLIWAFVVNNYLLGREPLPFDLLYWNSDSTRMPAAMHGFYLRRMYHENRLSEPGGLTLLGAKIDLRRIETPVYLLAAREDHIAPWRSAYVATKVYKGPRRFVLAASGHIAGVINPPSENKYCYWLNDNLPDGPDDWLAGAEAVSGSWWTDWARWVSSHGGDRVPARAPGGGGLHAIEEAPGSYVMIRARD